MRYEIVLAPQAIDSYKRLHAHVRAQIQDALERHLRVEPRKVSKSRIKRLRGLRRPQYRLRVSEMRVFYDVTETAVEVPAIVSKEQAQAWLDAEGTPEAGSRPGTREG